MAELFKNKYVVMALVFILLIVVALIARKTVKKMVENSRENKFDKNDGKLTNGIDVNYFVQSYHQALNPSGYSWMESWDGTDEDRIFSLAKSGKGHVNEISLAYKAKYQESLLDALTSELSTEDMEKWRSLAY